jgi:hypothetical protein
VSEDKEQGFSFGITDEMIDRSIDRVYRRHFSGWEAERLSDPIAPERQIYRGPPRNRHERRAMKKRRTK